MRPVTCTVVWSYVVSIIGRLPCCEGVGALRGQRPCRRTSFGCTAAFRDFRGRRPVQPRDFSRHARKIPAVTTGGTGTALAIFPVMNPAHLHLLLNHVPVLGTVFGVLLALLAMRWRSKDVEAAALWVFLVTAVVAVPVYLT